MLLLINGTLLIPEKQRNNVKLFKVYDDCNVMPALLYYDGQCALYFRVCGISRLFSLHYVYWWINYVNHLTRKYAIKLRDGFKTQPPVDRRFRPVPTSSYCSKQWKPPGTGRNRRSTGGWVLKSHLTSAIVLRSNGWYLYKFSSHLICRHAFDMIGFFTNMSTGEKTLRRQP